ncbi:hypothetical protein Cch01nite_33860 [Cellulomonas chitinilytica]|uniref:SCP domain-containing protein n=1 Tax=Cellulomonas chitinilytica TaxID=398759 RepID=A0A919P3I4_9CELL|nr:CAP domain-containing protein [Cellulomonas chitinilytica]GIG22662.1 hypothetical protein Cch01nite_33860 [Cellulomonas chitinilytica]
MTRGSGAGGAEGSARVGWVLVVVGMLLAGVAVALVVRDRDAPGTDASTTIQMPPATRDATPTAAPPPATPAPTAAEPAGPVVADPDAPWSADVDPGAYAEGLFVGTNDARAAQGLAALAWSDCAATQAVARAQALVGHDLEHAPLDPVFAACPSSEVAENLSRGAGTARRVVDLWLGSPGHRANLLATDLDELGVGCARDDDVLVCSQVFLGHA